MGGAGIMGSSESSMGVGSSVGLLAVGGEQYPEPVVVELSEAVGEPTDLFDDQVDGLGAAVRDAFGVEVGEYLSSPGTEGAAGAGRPREWGNWGSCRAP